MSHSSKAPKSTKARKKYVADLRSRFVAGTLDKVLIPNEPELGELLEALFGELATA